MRQQGQRLMAHGYAAFLRTIIDGKGAATWETLVREHYGEQGRARLSSQQVLREMAQIGLIHVCGWRAPEGRRRAILAPCFAYGPGDAAPHPGFQTGNAKKPWKRKTVRAELIGLKAALDALRDEDMHGKQLAAELGIGAQAARKLLRALQEARLVYVADWLRRANGGVQCPLYGYGLNQKDMPRPPRAATLREHWAKHNAVRSARRRTLHALGMSTTTRRVNIADLGFVHSMA